MRGRSAWGALLLCCVMPWGAASAQVPGDPIEVEGGRLDGKLLSTEVKAYFGVPFAAPPVRELRWKDPQPVSAWTGVRHADRFAPECIQTLRAHNINHYFGEEATSEDCLYLNVWAPADAGAGANRPVVVWIYGGGFTVGSAAMANYHGQTLARKGVVYVSIAYRLGALGFFAHPALTAESSHRSSGNQGLLDQIAALKWVQRNITRFGGDAGNVTIMGQSAGSMSVSVLQASPLAKGLFHRVIGMSGGAFGNAMPNGMPPLADAEAGGRRFQDELKAPTLAAMRDLPADRILTAQLESPLRYGPIVDGYLLPSSPLELFASGKQSDVPTMVGYTRDEDGNFALQARTWARSQSASGKSPVFAYLFSRVHPYVKGVTFADHDPATVGSYHSADIPYWLGTLESLNLFRKTRDWSDYDLELAEAMSDAVVSFATRGDPNPPGKSTWPAYRAKREQMREFGESVQTITWPDAKPARAASSAETPAVGTAPVLDDRYPHRRVTFPGGVESFADLTFSALTGYRPLTLDLYRPASTSAPRPLVIYVHGGGWQSGHTRHSGAFENWPAALASIAARGYVVASIEYRLSGEARFPAAIQDVKSAIRWLRAHAGEYGIDRQRAVIWGGSAGGQLAALAGTTCNVAALAPPGSGAESDCVQGVIAWYGIFDFATLGATDTNAPPARYLGCALSSCDAKTVAAASARAYIDRDDAPVLMIHGVDDKTVPIEQSRSYLQALQAKGVKAELVELPGVDHSFIGATPEATREASLRAFAKSLEFIDRTLGTAKN